MSFIEESILDCKQFEKLIGKKVSRIDLCDFDWKTKKWIYGKGNITIVFDDGTAIQGTDGEYGNNVIEIINDGVEPS